VRCQPLLRSLRSRFPELRVIADFDDLLSRRMMNLLDLHQPMLMGYAGALAPAFMRRIIEGPRSRALVRYEAAAVRRAEIEALDASDAVVLVSSVERHRLLDDIGRRNHRAVVHAIPPPATIKASAWSSASHYRFVFVGSDRVLHNRLSIDFLLDRWRRLRPKAELHIFGQQQRPQADIAGVYWRGYQQNIAEAYSSGSIVVVPSIIAGGVKTKVIEGWSYGCPVLGNAAAFEGIAIADYPLSTCEADWDVLLLDPAGYAELWALAARRGSAFVETALSHERYAHAWLDLVLSARSNPEYRESPTGAPRREGGVAALTRIEEAPIDEGS